MFSLPYFVSSFFLLVRNRKTCILAPVKMLENCLSLKFETFCVIAKQFLLVLFTFCHLSIMKICGILPAKLNIPLIGIDMTTNLAMSQIMYLVMIKTYNP